MIDHECPKKINEKKCPLRKWLKKGDLFKFDETDKNLLIPTAELYRLARAEYVQAIEHMNHICRDCLESKTK